MANEYLYCKNGERVEVAYPEDGSETIEVLYKGKKYTRDKSAIGKTLFLYDPTAGISQDDTVTVFLDSCVATLVPKNASPSLANAVVGRHIGERVRYTDEDGREHKLMVLSIEK